MGIGPEKTFGSLALGRRQVIGAAAALVAVPTLAVAAYGAPSRGDSTPAASPGASPAATPSAGAITIEAFEFGFTPSQLSVAVGDTIGLFSSGEFPHNFIIESYNDAEPVDFPMDGSTFDWTVPDDLEPGTYTFYCGIGNHRAQGMEGEITVTEATAILTLEAYEFGFEPAELTIATGATLELFSTGEFPHNFIIEGYEDEKVDFPEDGSTVEWSVPDSIPAGTYTFYCGVGNHRAQGMEGQITIS